MKKCAVGCSKVDVKFQDGLSEREDLDESILKLCSRNYGYESSSGEFESST